MYRRNILAELNNWKTKKDRKPLILRGARQTGKTVAIKMFLSQFSNPITLNLEREQDKLLFEKSEDIEQVVYSIELAKGKDIHESDTIIFIDEIQNSKKALQFLRFFYEDYPSLAIIAAGSLLESILLKEGFSFPVGRVEFLYLYPVTFDEFLVAYGKDKIYGELCNVTIKSKPSPVLHKLSMELFKQFILVGGMPACVAEFIDNGTVKNLTDIKESLIVSIKDDVSKYAKLADTKYIRHVLEYAPYHIGERITYDKFGSSDYRGREIKRAFDILEYAMTIQRLYGSFSTALPIEPNFRVPPKIIYLDFGLVCHKLGISEEILHSTDLNQIFMGKFSEQIVGQTFISMDLHRRINPCFWYRNSPGSTAEIDFTYQHKNMIIPIEIKSGKTGSLKSLHQFILASNANKAVRLYSGELSVDKVSVENKIYDLISIPFYLQFRINEIID